MFTTAQKIADARVIRLRQLRHDPSLLADYPHRYIAVVHSSRSNIRTIYPWLFWAVELLEGQGWETVGWRVETRWPTVILRRKARDRDDRVGLLPDHPRR